MKDNQTIFENIHAFIDSYSNFHATIGTQKVFPPIDQDKINQLQSIPLSNKARELDEVINEMKELVYSNQAYMQHPRCFIFIPSPASLLSWTGDIMTSAYNPHAGSWLQSSSASCIEGKLIRWMCDLANYPKEAGGLFVSGGSMANLTALATARNIKLNEDQYAKGIAYVSDQTHSSVAKGLRIIGFKDKQIRKVKTNEQFQLDVQALENVIKEDIARGWIPFAVIATSGTTNTGTIDPLADISTICKTHNLWMHVDGAYGASILVSKTHRHLLDGISHADSISWDAHKWLQQTYSCSSLLVKDQQHLLNTFSTHPEYLKDAQTNEQELNYWDLGPELTRPARSLKLWVTLQTLGIDALSDSIDHNIYIAEYMQQKIKNMKDWEIVSSAKLAIVNFCYAPKGLTNAQLDELNRQISKELLAIGYAGILTTQLHNQVVLRVCSIHPNTTETDIDMSVQLLDEIAKRLYFEKL